MSSSDSATGPARPDAAAWLAAIVESSDDAIIGRDLDGTITAWNRAAEVMFGYGADEVIGRPVTVLADDAHVAETERLVAAVREGGRVTNHETVRRRKDGTLFHVSVTVSPIHDAEGRLIGASTIARDITALVQMAAARAEADRHLRLAVEAKDLAARELSHRVKNTLQLVSSVLALQAMRITDPAVAKEFSVAHGRVSAIAQTHAALYDYGNRSVGGLAVGPLLRRLADSLGSMLGADRPAATLEVDADDTVLPADAAVPLALIVNELITNALKYAFQDGQPGRIRVGFRGDPACGFRLTVADDGRGLPADPGGRPGGVGLELVRALTQQIGGSMSMDSAAGLAVTVTGRPVDAA